MNSFFFVSVNSLIGSLSFEISEYFMTIFAHDVLNGCKKKLIFTYKSLRIYFQSPYSCVNKVHVLLCDKYGLLSNFIQ